MFQLRLKPQHVPSLFYFGTLISSVGSFTFTISLIAFMLRAGFTLFDASLIVGLSRLVPLLVSTLLGQKSDQFSPKATVLVTEIAAAASSMGIIWAWGLGKEGYAILLGFSLFRAVLMAFQAGSRARIVKQLGASHYQSQSSHAIWINQATQGAMFFAGIFAWIAIKNFSFTTVILFDASTFILNGLILFLLPIGGGKSTKSSNESVLKKFKDFYRFNPRAALLDAALAAVMMGSASFASRLAGQNQEWLSLFVILTIWLNRLATR